MDTLSAILIFSLTAFVVLAIIQSLSHVRKDRRIKYLEGCLELGHKTERIWEKRYRDEEAAHGTVTADYKALLIREHQHVKDKADLRRDAKKAANLAESRLEAFDNSEKARANAVGRANKAVIERDEWKAAYDAAVGRANKAVIERDEWKASYDAAVEDLNVEINKHREFDSLTEDNARLRRKVEALQDANLNLGQEIADQNSVAKSRARFLSLAQHNLARAAFVPSDEPTE